ncbi:MAG: helix-turn-helix domain-containing protein [Rhizomicrobium sp.]
MDEMNGLTEREDAVVPSKEDVALATESSRILSAMDGEGELRVRLEGDVELRLPSAVRTLLMHLLTEMSRGNAVTIIPIHAELTTQEAADFLNVSRPHVVKLLDRGDIAHHKAGSHRRVRFSDLQKYKASQEKKRDAALDELVSQAQGLKMGY